MRLPDVNRSTHEGWEVWEKIKGPRRELVAPPGAYMKVLREDGGTWCWYLRSPAGDVCTIGWQFGAAHQIVEHDDGTITVSPSIVFPNGGYHGFLQRGVWS